MRSNISDLHLLLLGRRGIPSLKSGHLEEALHVIGIFVIEIVLGLNLDTSELESTLVEVEGSGVGLTDVEGAEVGVVDFAHFLHGTAHQGGGSTELAVGAEDGEGGDVAVSLADILFVVDFGEDVTSDLVVDVFEDEEVLGPGEVVVVVVSEVVVFREAAEIAVLHLDDVLHTSTTDLHFFF